VSERFVCIHGHFYQPPREDPLTGVMPVEHEAAPYPNFNEKIHAECYAPNAELGNYELMSFNIGPTLATWMRLHHPDVLRKIAACDRLAIQTRGAGSAIAQSYHHTILPLANERDRRTEIRWGVRSFELLFGRKPVGIWLPETAVDTVTLEECADAGLRFTILAPTQMIVPGEPNGSYAVDLPSGRRFDVIVYDGGLGGTVSFDPRATTWAGDFAHHYVLPAFWRIIHRPALVAIATDGEVYGHHHKFKDMFLRELLERKLSEQGLTAITAEQFVMEHPADRRGKIREQSSWGCAHRLDRWSEGCSCTEGSSDWKRPLRAAFDLVAEFTDEVFETEGSRHLTDPWAARDAYVDVVDGAASFETWYAGWQPARNADPQRARLLLEAQRHRLAMYASCAFYWEDVGRIEPGYGIKRGLTAASLLDAEFGTSIGSTFREKLRASVSWRYRRSAAELHGAREPFVPAALS
jgi:alpha-amylase/alpha-mannosidase (GH57 family)